MIEFPNGIRYKETQIYFKRVSYEVQKHAHRKQTNNARAL